MNIHYINVSFTAQLVEVRKRKRVRDYIKLGHKYSYV